MPDVKMSEMVADSSVAGTEKILVLDGATSKTMLASVLSAYVIDQLVGAAEITPTAGDAFVVERSGTEGTFSIADAEAWVIDTVEAVGISTITASDWVIFSDAGVLKKITLANLAASFTDFPVSVLDIDGATDIGAALVGTDEIIVDDGGGGTNRRCDVSRIFDYVTTQIQGLAQKATPVDADILTIQDSAASNALKETTVAELWDNYLMANLEAETDISGATWVSNDNTLAGNSATEVTTEQAVKTYVDARTIAGVASFTGAIIPGTDQVLFDDGGTIKKATYQVFMDGIADLTAATIATGDSLVFIDSGSSSVARIETIDDLFGIGPALVTADTVDMTADHMLFLDGGASGEANKCSIQSLFNSVTAIVGGDNSLGITGQTQSSGVTGGTVTVAGAAGVGAADGGVASLTGGASGSGATGNGGAVNALGGDAASTNGAGGAFVASGGDGIGTGAGGASSLSGGDSGNGATGDGGNTTVSGGAAASSSGNGGDVTITAGLSTGANQGGLVAITAGNGGAAGAGGTTVIAGGTPTSGNAAGGLVSLTGGAGSGSGDGGAASLVGGAAAASAGSVGGAIAITGGAGAASATAGAVAIDAGAVGGGTGAGITVGLTNATAITLGTGINYGTSSGTDTIVLTLAPALTRYLAGQIFIFKPGGDNTGACTMNVNGLGAKNVKTQTGVDPAASDVDATGMCMMVYDGTNMVLINPATTTD
jgi:hypothetical protein